MAGAVVSALITLFVAFLLSVFSNGADLRWLFISLFVLFNVFGLWAWFKQTREMFSFVYLEGVADEFVCGSQKRAAQEVRQLRRSAPKREWREGSLRALILLLRAWLLVVAVVLSGLVLSLAFPPFRFSPNNIRIANPRAFVGPHTSTIRAVRSSCA